MKNGTEAKRTIAGKADPTAWVVTSWFKGWECAVARSFKTEAKARASFAELKASAKGKREEDFEITLTPPVISPDFIPAGIPTAAEKLEVARARLKSSIVEYLSAFNAAWIEDRDAVPGYDGIISRELAALVERLYLTGVKDPVRVDGVPV